MIAILRVCKLKDDRTVHNTATLEITHNLAAYFLIFISPQIIHDKGQRSFLRLNGLGLTNYLTSLSLLSQI